MAQPVILDTNVFVAAGFKPGSASGKVLDAVRGGTLRLVWNEDTRRETEHIVRRIPPLDWDVVAGLFREENRYDGTTDPQAFSFVADPDDRKFAALAGVTGAALLTMDDHLLGEREKTEVEILTPGELLRRLEAREQS